MFNKKQNENEKKKQNENEKQNKKQNENENEKKKQQIILNRVRQIMKIPYPLKKSHNSIIPLNIYQTWHTKDLPINMLESINLIKKLNPRFNHYLFDENDCREFIKNNFEDDVLNSYNNLIPDAYKADLWRYCILYKNGGIYLDIKYKPINNFRFISMTEKEYFVLDSDNKRIYNALIVCLPGNKILLKAINQIVQNVKNKFYGNDVLDPTGPGLLVEYFKNEEKSKFEMKHKFYFSFENRVIFFNNCIILKSYTGYLEDCKKYKNKERYSKLWNKKQIYNDI